MKFLDQDLSGTIQSSDQKDEAINATHILLKDSYLTNGSRAFLTQFPENMARLCAKYRDAVIEEDAIESKISERDALEENINEKKQEHAAMVKERDLFDTDIKQHQKDIATYEEKIRNLEQLIKDKSKKIEYLSKQLRMDDCNRIQADMKKLEEFNGEMKSWKIKKDEAIEKQIQAKNEWNSFRSYLSRSF
ncbi:hypothetical protein CJ030_MR6G010286 [Morella rubra]|uniref:Uncharacterized protein n=1 Tax=Morella rubra TaxID=262757 RepID=A0A6A1VCM7_9ROSI|nr:hypothetical protein CJ030_MR6G010286 [Morella rubra]